MLLLSCKKVKVKMGLSGTAGPTPVHLLRPFSEVQLITLKTPSFPTSHPYPHYHLHYLIIIFPTIKPKNTTAIISDVQLITKKTTSSTSIFRNDHPFLPTTIQPQNTIISSFSSSFKILSSVQKVGWLEGVNLGTAIL